MSRIRPLCLVVVFAFGCAKGADWHPQPPGVTPPWEPIAGSTAGSSGESSSGAGGTAGGSGTDGVSSAGGASDMGGVSSAGGTGGTGGASSTGGAGGSDMSGVSGTGGSAGSAAGTSGSGGTGGTVGSAGMGGAAGQEDAGVMCLRQTAACQSTSQCCDGFVCGTTTLGMVCCGEVGAPCGTANGEDCCGALWCIAGLCANP